MTRHQPTPWLSKIYQTLTEQMHQAWLDNGPRPVREVVASIIFAVFLPGFFQFPPIGSSLKLFVADRSRILCSSFAMVPARIPGAKQDDVQQSLGAKSADGSQSVTGPCWKKSVKNVIGNCQRRAAN
jgi:hypothetical protein